MRYAKSAVAVLAVAGPLLAAGPTLAAAPPVMPTSGPIRIFATPIGATGLHSTILIAGAIADWGTATTINANGTPNSNGNYVRITLHHGTFEVNSTTLNAKVNKEGPILSDQTTCSVVFGGTGPVTLFNGTGQYKGISGTVNITETFAGIAARFSSGPHKGQCNESNASEPIAFYASITGSGTVHFS